MLLHVILIKRYVLKSRNFSLILLVIIIKAKIVLHTFEL